MVITNDGLGNLSSGQMNSNSGNLMGGNSDLEAPMLDITDEDVVIDGEIDEEETSSPLVLIVVVIVLIISTLFIRSRNR